MVLTYWASNTVASGFQVIYNESGEIYLMGNNRRKLNDVLSNKALEEEFYQREIIDYDEVFRKLIYPKSAGSGTTMAWSPLSTFILKNICIRKTASIGSGACGWHGLRA